VGFDMHRKLIRRLLWMFVFVIAISAAVIYFTFDIRALEYLTMFVPEEYFAGKKVLVQ